MLFSLATPRLLLSPIAATDFDAFLRLLTEPQVRLFLCDDLILPSKRVREMLERGLKLAERGLGTWTIKNDGDWIGCVGLIPAEATAVFDPSLTGEIEPFIALFPHAWGCGYASEALKAVIAYAFGPLGLTRLVAAVDEPNAASHRLMVRMGFERTSEAIGPKYSLISYALERKNGNVTKIS